MDIQRTLDDHNLILMEAAVIESLRRSGKIVLHPHLENALLLYGEPGRTSLKTLYQRYIGVAHDHDVPMIICTPTWRANEQRLSNANLSENVNSDAVKFLKEIRETWGTWSSNIFIGGLVGCKNDSYKPHEGLSTDEAKTFHSWQINQLAGTGVDFLLGITLPALPEAQGIALAMSETRLPYIISFVINKESNILDGTSLERSFQENRCGLPEAPSRLHDQLRLPVISQRGRTTPIGPVPNHRLPGKCLVARPLKPGWFRYAPGKCHI